jgi:hypothetical protein
LITPVTFGEQLKLWSSSLCNFLQSTVNSSHLTSSAYVLPFI